MVTWILPDPEKCSGCGICEITCSLEHEGRIWPEASRIKVIEIFPGITIPVLCVHCKEKSCVSVCPTRALYENSFGNLELNKENCTKCGACVSACSSGAIFLHPGTGFPAFCDLCGGSPKCVEVCSLLGFGALKEMKSDDASRDTIPVSPIEASASEIKKIWGEGI